ncbi:alpha-L-fucosidase [Actinospongicola halichondriae]|uniref:alpha-L-fucosidase n=1 Tax=Actinospongicola halichondriae TaxID=3236844 RepID=UPI003D3A6126
MENGGTARSRFDDAKFGMFVHWGAYSVGGIEASWPVMLGPELQRRFIETLHRFGVEEVEMPVKPITLEDYEAFPQQFTAERFDAAEWVDLVRDAGQRYLVLTTKHHDGFALFDTDTTDYKTTNTPFGRDVVREVAGACRDGGVGFGAYFSAPDFHDAGYLDRSRPLPENFLGEPERPEWADFLARMERQVEELCTDYGDLYSWWWDIGFGPQWDIERFHGLVRKHQPDVLVNDRLGGLAADVPVQLRADFLTPEQSVPKSIPRRSTYAPMDPTMVFGLIQQDNWEELVEQVAPMIRMHLDAPPDSSVPDADDFLPWEACMTFGGQWAWNPDLDRCKTGADIIGDLVEVASRGGNLLMNVGPQGDGAIQPEFQDALRDVGRWLDVNGEAIHGTTYGPIQGHDDVRTTADADNIYVHVVPSAPGRIRIDGLAEHTSATTARALAADADVTVETDGSALVVDLGRIPRDPVMTTLRLAR